MKIYELLTEIKLDIPDQMIKVEVPLSSIINDVDEEDTDTVINPGKRAGSDGRYKWSGPLQQQLDVTKDGVGISNDEIDEPSANIEAEKELTGEEELVDLKSILSQLSKK
jgi:hypothetical protein